MEPTPARWLSLLILPALVRWQSLHIMLAIPVIAKARIQIQLARIDSIVVDWETMGWRLTHLRIVASLLRLMECMQAEVPKVDVVQSRVAIAIAVLRKGAVGPVGMVLGGMMPCGVAAGTNGCIVRGLHFRVRDRC